MNTQVARQNVTAIRQNGPQLTERQLTVLRETICKQMNRDEFSLFIEYARAKGLDPISRQIIPLIFNRDNADKRQMVIVTTQDGLRVLALRCGDYRPESEPPQFEIDKSLVSPINPAGIVKSTVTLYKRYGDQWFPVVGEARWSEFAPITLAASDYEWIDTGEVWPDTGKPKKRKKPIGEMIEKLDDSGQWAKMPYTMIAKCARCQSLRAGWAEFSGVYSEAEYDRAKVLDLTASEMVDEELAKRREALIHGAGDIPYVGADGLLAFVPVGKYFDHVMADALNCSTTQELTDMRTRNKLGLQDYWSKNKDDALTLRKKLDEAASKLVATKEQPQ